MTEGQEEHATQQLNENKEADEKPAEESSATADQRKEEESTRQLASGNNLLIRSPRVFWILNKYLMVL